MARPRSLTAPCVWAEPQTQGTCRYSDNTSARACLVAFDLLNLNGEDFCQRPIEERRGALSPLVAGVHCILFSDAMVAEGSLVFAKACELGLEGIVSKRVGSRYSSGNSRQWLKSKNPAFVRG